MAVGYLPGLYNPMTGAFTVRAGDALAWVEIHFRRSGWVVFDPTPRPDVNMGLGSGQGLLTFGLLDFVGMDFTGAFSSVTGDWSLGRLSVPRPGLAGPYRCGGICQHTGRASRIQARVDGTTGRGRIHRPGR